MSDSVRPHRQQPIRLLCSWDSPGKNPGVGCHFLLQCMKVKSESEVTQSCPTLSNPMDCSLPGSSVHGFSRQEYWSGVPLPSPLFWQATAQHMALLALVHRGIGLPREQHIVHHAGPASLCLDVKNHTSKLAFVQMITQFLQACCAPLIGLSFNCEVTVSVLP